MRTLDRDMFGARGLSGEVTVIVRANRISGLTAMPAKNLDAESA